MQAPDLTRVFREQPWYERALEALAPSWALRRLEARLQRTMLGYQAAESNRLFAPKTHGQSSESSRNARDRVVMMWEARDLVENSESAKTALSKFSNNVTPTEWAPDTGDRAYDQKLAEWFHEEWCKSCDFQRRHAFRKQIELATENRPQDGDYGLILRDTPHGIRIQGVDAPRIDNPNTSAQIDPHYYSGVIVDDHGAPVAYRVYRVTREGVYAEYEDVPARFFCHYFDPFRVDQYRGITAFHASSRTLRMQKETLEAENVAQVNKSRHAAIVFNERGHANPRQAFTPATGQTTLPSGETQVEEYAGIGRVLYMKRGDSVATMPARPGEGFLDYQNYTDHLVARGLDLPYGALFGTDGYKGSNIRAEFAQADRIYERHRGVLEPKVTNPIKNAALLDAFARGLITLPPRRTGEDIVDTLRRALRGQWRYPAKLTIDVGHESQANLAENRQGLKSPQRIAAENNSDAFQTAREIVAWTKFLQDECKVAGVPEAAVRLLTNTLPQTPAGAAATGPGTGEAAAEAQAGSAPGGAGAQASGDASPKDKREDGEGDEDRDSALSASTATPAASTPADRAARVRAALAGPRARRAEALGAVGARQARLATLRQKLGDKSADAARARSAFEKLTIP